MDEKQWEDDWKKIWRPSLLTDGKLDEQKIKNEMHDLVFIYKQVGEVYKSLTGGMLSKPMYYAQTIIQLHEERIQQAYDEGLQEAQEDNQSNKIT
jgi:hypothetical protein